MLSLQLAFLKEDFPERTGHTAGAQSMAVTMPGCGTRKECSCGYGPGPGSDTPDFSGFSTKIPASREAIPFGPEQTRKVGHLRGEEGPDSSLILCGAFLPIPLPDPKAGMLGVLSHL